MIEPPFYYYANPFYGTILPLFTRKLIYYLNFVGRILVHLFLQCFSHTSQHIRYKKKDFTFHEIFSNRLLDESKEGVFKSYPFKTVVLSIYVKWVDIYAIFDVFNFTWSPRSYL